MNIGILGFGTIGSGVYELAKNKVLKVFDLPSKKEVLKDLYVSNYLDITEDENIDIVVECMGGNDLPYTAIKSALKNKKHVVTSNKEVVSLHLKEFNELAKENNVYFMFEASVGGGIPIIENIKQISSIDSIDHIYGIINGTTNFIISKIEEGLSFDSALALTKNKGFAESDPTADLEGLDMVRKISILSDIAYNTFIDINDVTHYGIKNINKEMIDFLNKLDLTIKFMAESIKSNEGISLSVTPVVINRNSKIAQTKDEFNIIGFNAENNGILEFVGKGAGKYPTASAIISDIKKLENNIACCSFDYSKPYKIMDKQKAKYFIYSKDQIDSKFIDSKFNSFYFTKEIYIDEVTNYEFYAKIKD